MIALFLLAATTAAQSTPVAARPAAAPHAEPGTPPGTARAVVEAQLRSAPRADEPRALNAEEADAIYKQYIASIGRQLERAPDNRAGGVK